MKIKSFFRYALLGLCSLVLVGCNSELKHENETLKREQDALKKDASSLQQQLQEMRAEIATSKSATDRLKDELDQSKESLLKLKEELSSARIRLDMQNINVEKLTKDLMESQKAKEKAEKSLELYRDKASAACRELKSLRGSFDESTIQFDDFNRNYIATKMEVTKLIDVLPESEIRRRIVAILQTFSGMKTAWEDSQEENKRLKSQCELKLFRWNGEARLNVLNEIETTKGRIRILEEQVEAEKSTKARLFVRFELGKAESDQSLQKLQSLLAVND